MKDLRFEIWARELWVSIAAVRVQNYARFRGKFFVRLCLSWFFCLEMQVNADFHVGMLPFLAKKCL